MTEFLKFMCYCPREVNGVVSFSLMVFGSQGCSETLSCAFVSTDSRLQHIPQAVLLRSPSSVELLKDVYEDGKFCNRVVLVRWEATADERAWWAVLVL